MLTGLRSQEAGRFLHTRGEFQSVSVSLLHLFSFSKREHISNHTQMSKDEQVTAQPENCYLMDHKQKGHAIIIYNGFRQGSKHNYRHGCMTDVEDFNRILTEIGFQEFSS